MLGRWFNNNLNAFSGPFPICCIANVLFLLLQIVFLRHICREVNPLHVCWISGVLRALVDLPWPMDLLFLYSPQTICAFLMLNINAFCRRVYLQPSHPGWWDSGPWTRLWIYFCCAQHSTIFTGFYWRCQDHCLCFLQEEAVLGTEISPKSFIVPKDFGSCSPEPLSLHSPSTQNLVRNGIYKVSSPKSYTAFFPLI